MAQQESKEKENELRQLICFDQCMIGIGIIISALFVYIPSECCLIDPNCPRGMRDSGVIPMLLSLICCVWYLCADATQTKREEEEWLRDCEPQLRKDLAEFPHNQTIEKAKENAATESGFSWQRFQRGHLFLVNVLVCFGFNLVLVDVLDMFVHGHYSVVIGGVWTFIFSVMSFFAARKYYDDCSHCLRAHVYMSCLDDENQPFEACCFPQYTVAKRFRKQHNICEFAWKKGDLEGHNIISLPKDLRFPSNLTQLDLSSNQIDVSGLNLPPGLEELDLSRNQIENVSGLNLPTGLKELKLDGNRIQRDKINAFKERYKNIQLSAQYQGVNTTRTVAEKAAQGLGSTDTGNAKVSTKAGPGKSEQVEGKITAFKDKYGISKEDWEKGDLGGKRIVKLPPQFAPGLKRLDLKVNDIVDVSGLTFPEGLEELDLSHNQIVEVSGLKLPAGLQKLNLDGNQIKDINKTIAQWKETNKQLTVTTTQTVAGKAAKQLASAQSKTSDIGQPGKSDDSTTGDSASNIARSDDSDRTEPKVTKSKPGKAAGAGRSTPVQNAIDTFKINHRIADEQWTAGELNNKSIVELPPQFAPGLTTLHLGYNEIEDVSRLTLPEGLTDLWLNGNQLVDVSGLTLPEGLELLDLSDNKIVDVSRLTKPKGLTELNLGFNQIVDVSGLTLPKGLTKLFLGYNQIVDVSNLKLQEGLKELYLSGNLIVDVSKLELPPGLNVLDLIENEIVDVSELTLLEGLTKLDLTSNKIPPDNIASFQRNNAGVNVSAENQKPS